MKKENLIILAIESTCDETSVAIVRDGVISEVLTHSQISEFKNIGGVVPQIASDLHSQRLPILLKRIMENQQLLWKEIDCVAYADQPGLECCLLIGRAAAKTIAARFQIPIMPLNHLEAHYWIASYQKKVEYPVLGVIISGGHSHLVLVKNINQSTKVVGQTIDDAAGECLDKVARYLNLGYPGGPIIEKWAKLGEKTNIKLSVYEGNDLNFSFSGLKTGCIQYINKQKNQLNLANFTLALENVIFGVIEKKIKKAIKMYKIKTLLIGGGVLANQHLRRKIKNIKNVKILISKQKYCTDNAGMIGYLAYLKIKNDDKNNSI